MSDANPQHASPKVVHLRDANNNPYGTVAYTTTDTGIKYGISLCHFHDQFVKVTGRNKAVGRFNSKRESHFIPVADGALDMSHTEVMDAILATVKNK